MVRSQVVGDEVIEDTIRRIRKKSFTVLDFSAALEQAHPEDWRMLKDRFGTFGQGRYTVSTYLSNRLDLYSHRGESLLIPFTRHSQGGFKDYRRPTDDEKRTFGSPWIAVFRKRAKKPRS